MQILRSDEFARQVKRLSRKHRLILDDIEAFLDELEQGHRPGKPFRGVEGRSVRWARMQNSSSKTGKSGGFRVVYYFDDDAILLIMIDTRSTFGHIPAHRILDALEHAGID